MGMRARFPGPCSPLISLAVGVTLSLAHVKPMAPTLHPLRGHASCLFPGSVSLLTVGHCPRPVQCLQSRRPW